jgi:protein-tyrosine phosphatase
MDNSEKIEVLFVCMGNICRSPTAEAVFRAVVERAGMGQHILIDSAGTHDYHVGKPPDARAQRAAMQRGYDMGALRGRQVQRADFSRFDYVLAMDNANLALLRRLRPQNATGHMGLFLDFSSTQGEREVPDPYYGGASGFEHVLDLVEDASEGLMAHLRRTHFLA